MGPFELHGPRRGRRRLRGRQVVLRAELRRAALAPVRRSAAHRRGRPPRAQDRPRLVRLRRRPAPPATTRTRPSAGGGDGRLVVIAGDLPVADELRGLRGERGLRRASSRSAPRATCRASRSTAAPRTTSPPLAGRPARACSCADGLAARARPGGGAVGFHALPPLGDARLVELTRSADDDLAVAAERAEALLRGLGRHVAWVGDAPGLVLGRIVCQLVNEACFARQRGRRHAGGHRRRA